uniref:protein-serine/threonine phosphatase n=1 Tax=Magnetococcus massalia (strain MO-1) TaxID=451514 RepID=A0A1S7LMH0_MAGMO|nr:conserved protein of unknown function [Candidatus Magnetococcus massalia]
MIVDFFSRLFGGEGRLVELDQPLQLIGEKVRIPLSQLPLEISLGKGGERIHLRYETPSPVNPSAGRLLLHNPTDFYHAARGFLAIEAQEKLLIGVQEPFQQALFHWGPGVANRHLEIGFCDGMVLIKELHTDYGIIVSSVKQELGESTELPDSLNRLLLASTTTLLPDLALQQLEQLLASDTLAMYRPLDEHGQPGALVELPEGLEPVIIGDLHAQVENLLQILTWGGLLKGLQEGRSALVILGDAVHSELDGEMACMAQSMVMMDLIFGLMLLYPGQVFYLKGNHDGFDRRIMKAGVAQGLLWRESLRKKRGEAYLTAMERLYAQLPLVAVGRELLCCHASPPIARVDKPMIINAQAYPGLVNELLWNRIQCAAFPSGYGAREVKRFRKLMGLSPTAAFIVSHNPISRQQALWPNVQEVKNHHIVFSGLPHCIGLFVQTGEQMQPLVLPGRALVE